LRPRLIIVDDEPAIRDTLARLLPFHVKDLNPVVIQLSTAEELVDWLVEDHDNTVVVTDNNTRSRMTGLEALCTLRARGIHTPIVVFSGDTFAPAQHKILTDCGAEHVRKSSSRDTERLAAFIRTAVASMRPRACDAAEDTRVSL